MFYLNTNFCARKVAQEAIKECQLPAPISQKDAIVNSWSSQRFQVPRRQKHTKKKYVGHYDPSKPVDGLKFRQMRHRPGAAQESPPNCATLCRCRMWIGNGLRANARLRADATLETDPFTFSKLWAWTFALYRHIVSYCYVSILCSCCAVLFAAWEVWDSKIWCEYLSIRLHIP